MRAYISDLNIFLPERKVSSLELELQINQNGTLLAEGSIDRLFGVQERRYADVDVMVSDLATNAAKKIVAKHGAESIDCLIFASACGDLIEPATANIIQEKLGLTCPSFDVKNACNSFVTALQIASSFIDSGVHKKVLIVSGEKTSNSIRFQPENEEVMKRGLAAFSFGDAGSAVLVERSTNESGLYYQKFKTVGKHWQLCTIKGGGSMFPFDSDKNYFEGKTSELAEIMIKEGGTFFQSCLKEAGWQLSDIDHVVTHQVSWRSFEKISEQYNLPMDKIIKVCDLYGNTAAVSIPLSIYTGIESGKIKHGDKIAIVGLAAGISISIQFLVWE